MYTISSEIATNSSENYKYRATETSPNTTLKSKGASLTVQGR